MAANLEPAALKAQIITELLPLLQRFVQNQPAVERAEKTVREKAMEKRAQEREESRAQSRQKYLAQIEKNKGSGRLPPPIAAGTSINATPRLNPANDPAKFVSNGSLQSAVRTATTDLTGIQNQVGALSTQVDALDGRLTTVEGDLATLDFDVDLLVGDVDDLDERLTTVEGDLTILDFNVDLLVDDVADLDGRLTTVEGDLTILDFNVDLLVDDVADLDERLTTAEDKLSSMYPTRLQYVDGNYPASAEFLAIRDYSQPPTYP